MNEDKTARCKLCNKPIKPRFSYCYPCMVKEGHFSAEGHPAKSEQDLRDNRLRVRDELADKFLNRHRS